MNKRYYIHYLLLTVVPALANAMELASSQSMLHYGELCKVSEKVAQQYFYENNLDKNVPLGAHVKNGLALVNDEAHKTAIAVFEIPEQNERYYLTEQEREHAQSMFDVYKVENKGKYKVIRFRYNDKDILPENKDQASFLLYSPYLKRSEKRKELSLRELQKYLLFKKSLLKAEQQRTIYGNEINERSEGIQERHVRLQQLKALVSAHYEGFLDSTIVNTDKGHCKIGELKVGDTVTCYDINNNKQMYSTVTYVDKRQLPNYIQITIDNQTLQVASQHKFYAKASNEWVTAQQLKDVPELRKLVDFTIQDIKKVNQPLDVVRITVDGNHNFYITDHNILVHNFIPLAVGLSIGISWGAGAGVPITWAVLHPTLAATASVAGYWLYSKLKPDRERTQPKFELQSQGQDNSARFDPSFDAKKKNNPKEVKPDKQESKPGAVTGGPQPPKDPNKKDSGQRNNDNNNDKDNDKNKKNGTVDRKLNNKEAREQAKKWGFQEDRNAPFDSHGALTFRRGNRWLSPDQDIHSGGSWKEFLNGRRSTLDANGNPIGK